MNNVPVGRFYAVSEHNRAPTMCTRFIKKMLGSSTLLSHTYKCGKNTHLGDTQRTEIGLVFFFLHKVILRMVTQLLKWFQSILHYKNTRFVH